MHLPFENKCFDERGTNHEKSGALFFCVWNGKADCGGDREVDRDHYNELARLAKKEHYEDRRPEIKSDIDISGYGNIFIGERGIIRTS